MGKTRVASAYPARESHPMRKVPCKQTYRATDPGAGEVHRKGGGSWKCSRGARFPSVPAGWRRLLILIPAAPDVVRSRPARRGTRRPAPCARPGRWRSSLPRRCRRDGQDELRLLGRDPGGRITGAGRVPRRGRGSWNRACRGIRRPVSLRSGRMSAPLHTAAPDVRPGRHRTIDFAGDLVGAGTVAGCDTASAPAP